MVERLILASGSQNRRNVMDALNVSYESIPADIDEKAFRDEDLALRAKKIARAKAENVAAEHDGIIIAADSFAENNGKVYEKPADVEEARQMLREQSGGKGKLYVGFCYLDRKNDIDHSETIAIDFSIRKLEEDEITAWVEKNPVTTWSGGIFPGTVYGASMIENVNGSFSGYVYGFPTEILIPLLKKSGFSIHP